MQTRSWISLAFAAAFASGAHAGTLVITVTGVSEAKGEIGCSLFREPTGFPMDNSAARVQWLPAQGAGTVCRFNDVPEGSYAVAVAHDLNGNRRVDTNFFGIPTEAWGVSNNVRPSLRPPRFEEAVFRLPGGSAETALDIRVAR
jgi:uncharacterized protein (DUF2141 family)